MAVSSDLSGSDMWYGDCFHLVLGGRVSGIPAEASPDYGREVDAVFDYEAVRAGINRKRSRGAGAGS